MESMAVCKIGFGRETGRVSWLGEQGIGAVGSLKLACWKPCDGHAPQSVALVEEGLKAYVFAQFSGMNVKCRRRDWYGKQTKDAKSWCP